MWRIFATEAGCQSWCDGEWVAMARERSTLNNGHLNDVTDGGTPVDVTVLDDADITPDRFPLWGQRSGQWNTTDGFTTAWAIPQQTAAGEWAAPCRDPQDPAGQPEPAWPDPPEDVP